jgi:SAM-dependent methyltransferase
VDLLAQANARTVCDVGGGANPVVALDVIRERGLRYLLVDISREELGKAPPEYEKIVADIAADVPDLEPQDAVVTRMVAEHMRDAHAFHRNVRSLLREGGIAIHLFPTLYAPPFLVNRLLPEALTDRLLRILDPGRDPHGKRGKFRAYYEWCRGPTAKQIERLEHTGYELVEYVGFFGDDYLARIRPIQMLQDRLAAILVDHPIPHLTSYAYVVLRRTNGAAA